MRNLKLLVLILATPTFIIDTNTCEELAFMLALPIVFMGVLDENETIATTTQTTAKIGAAIGVYYGAHKATAAMWYGGWQKREKAIDIGILAGTIAGANVGLAQKKIINYTCLGASLGAIAGSLKITDITSTCIGTYMGAIGGAVIAGACGCLAATAYTNLKENMQQKNNKKLST